MRLSHVGAVLVVVLVIASFAGWLFLAADPETIFRRPALAAPWPEQEVWVWSPSEAFRQVEVQGAAGIDPHQPFARNPGDIVLGDDDGLIVATAAELRALVPAARAIEARETVVRANIEAGRGLISMITLAEHVDALQRGEPSKLAFKLED